MKTFIKTDDRIQKIVIFKSLEAVDDIKNIAINKTKVVKSIQYNFVETPKTNKAKDGQYKSLLMRLRSSPDEDTVQILKTSA